MLVWSICMHVNYSFTVTNMPNGLLAFFIIGFLYMMYYIFQNNVSTVIIVSKKGQAKHIITAIFSVIFLSNVWQYQSSHGNGWVGEWGAWVAAGKPADIDSIHVTTIEANVLPDFSHTFWMQEEGQFSLLIYSSLYHYHYNVQYRVTILHDCYIYLMSD